MEIIKLNNDICANNRFWSELLRGIYDSFEIYYVVNKGKNYMNCSSMWYDATEIREKFKQEKIKIVHKEHICSSYFECNIKSKINVKNVDVNEIKYIFGGKFRFDDENFDKEYYVKVKTLLEEIENKNETHTISNIKFVLEKEKSVKIINDHGINEDHRGSDHMIIKLPFMSNVELNNEFTLKDLIIACTNIKSHKFDNWYEMYCYSKCEIMNNQIIINTIFDHGS